MPSSLATQTTTRRPRSETPFLCLKCTDASQHSSVLPSELVSYEPTDLFLQPSTSIHLNLCHPSTYIEPSMPLSCGRSLCHKFRRTCTHDSAVKGTRGDTGLHYASTMTAATATTTPPPYTRRFSVPCIYEDAHLLFCT